MTDFDLRARDWDSDPLKVERARVVAEAIRRLVPLSPSLSALEYGCGTGLLSFFLQPHLGPITLADSSVGMLEVLREKITASGLPNLFPLRLDLSTDPLPDARFDLIYMSMVLHHVPDTRSLLGALYTLLKAPGTLCIADLDKEDGSFHGAGFDGHHGFDRTALAAELTEVGFAPVHFSTVFQMVKQSSDEARSYPLFLAVAQKSSSRLEP